MLTLDLIDQRTIDDVTHKIARIPHLTFTQAEDAVSDGLMSLYEKAEQYEDRDTDALKGLLYTFARFAALKIREKAKRQQADSLDSMSDVAETEGTGRRRLAEALTDRSFSFDVHDELLDLVTDALQERKLAAARKGASFRIAFRGAHSPAARYSDDQVQRVRELRADGCSRAETSALTGVRVGYISRLALRQDRAAGSTEGWTRELMIYAVKLWTKEHGKPPGSREAGRNLPGSASAWGEFGSWNAMILAAGLQPNRANRDVWDSPGLARAFFAFRREHGRWPRTRELRSTPGMPRLPTIKRHWGTERMGEIVERATTEFLALLPEAEVQVA